jgi:glycerol kinase
VVAAGRLEVSYVLAIDQGTTSTRAILFSSELTIVAAAQQEFAQHYPAPGCVEHDPEDIWRATLATGREALAKAGARAAEVAAIGVANQRETTLIWDRKTGEPIHRAIVWQDRRTAGSCEQLRAAGCEALVAARTGLLLDPYFSATKIAWLLDNVAGARARAERGELAFGTVDALLLWRLTGGAVHSTDATNASRTLLYDIRRGQWDDELLALFRVPRAILPEVRDSADDFGFAQSEHFGARIAIRGVAGDQQAATVGQACFAPGMTKATYGTGAFALVNTGRTPVVSSHRLLTTIAYRLDGETTYALEGSIFVAGAAVQWLRDGLGVIRAADETGALAAAADPAQSVYLVPAFVGLGAPYWDPDCRGALFGLTRATGPKEIARAALESVGYQTLDLIEAMRADWPPGAGAETVLRVDGGMAASDWAMQRLADILDAPVDRPAIKETTALGAAYLAGLHVGLYPPLAEFAARWRRERAFRPTLAPAARAKMVAGWRDAVARTLSARKL